MTDPIKVKERIARGDGSVAPHHASMDAKIAEPKPVAGEGKIEPHDRESEVTTAITLEKLICPEPQRLCMIFWAWPGNRLLIETRTRL